MVWWLFTRNVWKDDHITRIQGDETKKLDTFPPMEIYFFCPTGGE